MRHLTTNTLSLGLFALAAGCSGGGGGGGSGGGGGHTPPQATVTVLGLTTGNRLVSFEPGAPGTLLSTRLVSGLAAGEELLAIDYRPGTGDLYALGNSSRIYTVATSTGVATPVGAGPFAPALTGTAAGLDFNPVVDRVRAVSDADQNLRLHPDTGAVVGTDSGLAFAAADPNNGADPTVVASAFTNSFFGATSTTLFGIDAGLNVLVTQGSPNGAPVSPNTGTLFTVGPLGVDTSNEAGLDVSVFGGAFASLTAPGSTTSDLYAIHLGTGVAVLLGTIGGGSVIRDIALVPPPPRVFAITTTNKLISFRPLRPNSLLATLPVTGLQSGEDIVGIDFRPATGALIALGDTSRMYEIDTTTGVASVVGSGPFAPSLAGVEFGVDFNPVPDRLRVVSDADQNLRLNPNTGVVVATDTALAYGAADPNNGVDPTLVAAAYTSNFAGSSTTTLYGIDSALDIVVRQGSPGGSPLSPNSGTLFTIGSLNVDASQLTGFDVSGLGGVLASITAPAGTDSQLYLINLTSGIAGLLGTIGGPATVRDIAIELPVTPLFYGITSGSKLVSFVAGEPGSLLSTVTVSGLQAGESVLAIDFRPSTRDLVALGSSSRLYTIDRTSGLATQIGAGAFGLALAGAEFGFDFNPAVDRIRVVSDLDQSLRLHPVTGTIVGVDAIMTYDAGDVNAGANPSVIAAAFSPNFAATMTTTLYGIDSLLDVLVTQGSPSGTPVSPNSGRLFTVGSLGIDASQIAGFDVSVQGGAFAAVTAAGASDSQLYSVNLTTGLATLVGTIGGPETIRGLAAAPAGL